MTLGRGVTVTVGVGVAVAVAVAVAVGVAIGVPVGVAVGHDPLVTLISTEAVVVEPVYPPTATAVLPTAVPAQNERIWFKTGSSASFTMLCVTTGGRPCRFMANRRLRSMTRSAGVISRHGSLRPVERFTRYTFGVASVFRNTYIERSSALHPIGTSPG